MEDSRIIKTEYSEEMQKSFIDYAMSVIIARALPDVRDGLKPVQRRTLYDMYELGIRYDRPYRKCARIVGDTMGKYHPHGDSSIYEALVVMTQDFKRGLPLVDGHGNFGNIEGDGAAAMRYTEARLQKVTQEAYLADLDKDVVDFVPNFDETEKEPAVLPVKLPNFLINGSEGIAVGMATSTPPHNLGEVVDAMKAYMRDENVTTRELMRYLKGPDFPTGGIVTNKDDLLQIYETGTGKIKVRGKVEFEKLKGGKVNVVITEIPYPMIGMNISKFLSDVAGLVESKKTLDVVDISNQSSNVDFQFQIATRKYNNLLARELERKEVQEGLIKACNVIDLIIEILRGSKDRNMAKVCLVEGKTAGIKFKSKESKIMAAQLSFTERQANAILEMRLYKLIGLEIEALIKEHEDTMANIYRYEDILDRRDSMAQVIINELDEFRKAYSRKRRTVIDNVEEAVYKEKEIEETEVIFLMDRFGYAKTVDTAAYERTKEAADAENKYVFSCKNTGKVCLFTSTGQLHTIKVMDIPFGRFRDKGTPIDNISNYNSEKESIVCITSQTELNLRQVIFVTAQSMVKLVDGGEFDVSKRTVAATKLGEGDSVVSVMPLTEQRSVVLRTKEGYFLRFSIEEIPEKKKGALGVRGMKLGAKDAVEDAYYIKNGEEVIIEYKDKPLALNSLRPGKRDTKGTKKS